MSFMLRPAVREKIGLLFAIAGASGSGKTLSALKLAKGIANGVGKIAVIDTEAGRALHYAPKPGLPLSEQPNAFEFMHLDFPPPFTPERYVEAIQACEAAGATIIILDSASHEWNGEGGCSDMAEEAAIAAATDRNGNFQAWKVEAMTGPSWKKPKMRHKRMMARLIQSRTHLIFCLRAEEKVKFVKVPTDKGGEKTTIVPVGFQPICEKGFMFEMSGSMTLHPLTPGRPRYDLPCKLNDDLRAIFSEDGLIDEAAGKRLRMWAETGEDRPPTDRAAEGVRGLIERIQDADGKADLSAIIDSEAVVRQRGWLSKHRPELAKRVDEAVATAMAVYGQDDPPADPDDIGFPGDTIAREQVEGVL